MSSFDYYRWEPIVDISQPGDGRVSFLELLEQLRSDVDRLADTAGSVGQLDAKLREIERLIASVKRIRVHVDSHGIAAISDGTSEVHCYTTTRMQEHLAAAKVALEAKIASLTEVVNANKQAAADADTQLIQRLGEAKGEVEQKIADLGRTMGVSVDQKIDTKSSELQGLIVANTAKIADVEERSLKRTVMAPVFETATPDDATDDLKRAIRAAVSKRILHIPPGIYRCNSTITVPENMTLRGEGTIAFNGVGAAIRLADGANLEGITVESSDKGVQVIGRSRLSGVTVGAVSYAVEVQKTVSLVDCDLQGDPCLTSWQSSYVSAINTRFMSVENSGTARTIQIQGTATVESCEVNRFNQAIYLGGSGNITVINTRFHPGFDSPSTSFIECNQENRLHLIGCYFDVTHYRYFIRGHRSFHLACLSNRITGNINTNFELLKFSESAAPSVLMLGNNVSVNAGVLLHGGLPLDFVSDTSPQLKRDGITYTGGWIQAEKGIACGHGPDFPEHPQGIPVGSMFWHFDDKRPYWWNGQAWCDATGVPKV